MLLKNDSTDTRSLYILPSYIYILIFIISTQGGLQSAPLHFFQQLVALWQWVFELRAILGGDGGVIMVKRSRDACATHATTFYVAPFLEILLLRHHVGYSQ